MIEVALAIHAAAACLFVARIVRGRSLADRVVAFDGLVTILVAAIIVGASRSERIVTLPTVLVLSLVGFVGTGVLARFIERRGGQ